jgi:hypothetical protein
MAQVECLVITAGRKVSANYSTREAGYTVTVRLEEGDDAKALLSAWTRKLQWMTDTALGDMGDTHSFAANTPANGQGAQPAQE